MTNSTELQIVLNAVDNASKELENVKTSLNDLSGTAETVAKKQESMTSSVFNGVAAWDMLKGGVEAVAGFMEEANTEALKAVEGQNMLNAVLDSTKGISGETAVSINALAESMQKSTGVNKEAVVAGDAVLLKFTNIGKDVFPKATQAMIDMATAMNAGLKPSADQLANTAKTLGLALQDPENGFTRLKRAGVEFSTTQQQQIKDFEKTGEVAKAQGVIISQLGVEFGGAAEASKTPMDDMNNAIHNLQVGIGESLMPTMREWESNIADLLGGVASFIEQNQSTILEVGKLVAVAIAAAAAILMIQQAVVLTQAAIAFFNGTMMISPWGIAIAGAALLAAGVVYLSDTFGGFGNAMKVVGLSLESMGEVFVLGLKMLGNQLITWVNQALEVGNKAYNYISDLLKKVGVDIGRADMKIGFQFDENASAAALAGIGKQVNDMQDAAIKIKKTNQDAADAKVAAEAAAQAKLAALGNMNQANQDAIAANSTKDEKKIEADLKAHTDAVDKLKTEYQTVRDKIETEMAAITETHEKSVTSITDNINKVKTDLADLAATYTKTQETLSKNLTTSQTDNTSTAADAVVAAQQNIADLKTQIATETDATKLASLQAELKKEQDAYNSEAGFISSIQTQVTEAQRVAGLTDLQRAVENYQKKQAAAQADYDIQMAQLNADTTAKQNALNTQLLGYQLELKNENDLYKQKVDAIQKMEDDANIEYQKGVEDNFAMTTDTINKEIKLYQDLANAIAKVSSANIGTISTIKAPTISGARASGGPVSSGNAYLVGENGPELFIPSNSGSIAANGSGMGGTNITVNISGNNISNKMDLRNITDAVTSAITAKLRLNTKLSV